MPGWSTNKDSLLDVSLLQQSSTCSGHSLVRALSKSHVKILLPETALPLAKPLISMMGAGQALIKWWAVYSQAMFELL